MLEIEKELFVPVRKLSLGQRMKAELLAALIKEQPSIAVAGSHGKTTTSTIITTLIATNNLDPTAIVGGIIPHYKANAHAGKGELLIAEADESDGSLVKFKADLGLITNLELDHTDHYPTIEDLIVTMKTFRKNCKRVLGNYDCKNIKASINCTKWWSIEKKDDVDYAGIPIHLDGNQTTAEVYEKGEFLGKITIQYRVLS